VTLRERERKLGSLVVGGVTLRVVSVGCEWLCCAVLCCQCACAHAVVQINVASCELLIL